MTSILLRNFWQQSRPRDPELGIPPRESCCFPEHVCRDWTQYMATPAIILGLGGVAYGYFSKNYVVASVAAALALVIFVVSFRVWCLIPGSRLGENVIALANERKRTKQQLDQAETHLKELQNTITDLHSALETEKNVLEQTKALNQDAITNYQAQNQKLEDTTKRYESLKTIYDQITSSLKKTEGQLAELRTSGKVHEAAAKVIRKEQDRLDDSTTDLHHGIDRLDSKNNEFDGENNELLGHLKNLEREVSRLKTYIITLEKLLTDLDASKEAAERALKQAQEENRIGDLLSEAADALNRVESHSDSALNKSGD